MSKRELPFQSHRDLIWPGVLEIEGAANALGARLELSTSHGDDDKELTLSVKDLSGQRPTVTYLVIQEDEMVGKDCLAIISHRFKVIRGRVMDIGMDCAPGHFIDGDGI